MAARALDTVVEGMAVAEFQELMAAEPAVLVDFYTTWCGPCKVLDVALKVRTWGAPNPCCCLSCSRAPSKNACMHLQSACSWAVAPTCGQPHIQPRTHCAHTRAQTRPPTSLLPCPPSPQALEPSYKGRCAFLKVDAQQNYQLAQHFKVSKLPTMLVFRGGVQASV